MVEVFKTNVTDKDTANEVISSIHEKFPGYTANFDLTDCDRILRVKCTTTPVEARLLIRLLKERGLFAEVLPDDSDPTRLHLQEMSGY